MNRHQENIIRRLQKACPDHIEDGNKYVFVRGRFDLEVEIMDGGMMQFTMAVTENGSRRMIGSLMKSRLTSVEWVVALLGE